MGAATSAWLTGLPSGVMTAATTKMMRTAYLMLRARNPADTMPSRASTSISMGIWKTRPMPSINFTYRLNTGSMRGVNSMKSFEKPAKKRHAAGNST